MAVRKKAKKKKTGTTVVPDDVKVSGVIFTEVQQLRNQVTNYEADRLASCDLLGNLRDYLEGTSHETLHRTQTMIALTDALLKLNGD